MLLRNSREVGKTTNGGAARSIFILVPDHDFTDITTLPVPVGVLNQNLAAAEFSSLFRDTSQQSYPTFECKSVWHETLI